MADTRTRSVKKVGTFKINTDSLLEAKDAYGTWYPAKVLSIKENKVHIHFCNWSSRFDTWYPIDSDNIRPLKRVSTTAKSMPKPQSTTVPEPSSPSKESGSETNSSEQFELNSYVMAAWRNEYEYLAEVIAHRHRQGGRSEYRLRYVWDRVVEWTPSNRLRKATQFEIDYVLKFCREHSGTIVKNTHTHRSPTNDSRNRSPSINQDHDITKYPLGTRSHSKRRDTHQSDVQHSRDGQQDHSQLVSVTSESEEKKSASFISKIEQNGMVYDRSVAQFHEACRKRRELKRQAIEAEKIDNVKNESASQPAQFVDGANQGSHNSTNLHMELNGLTSAVDAFENSVKAPRLEESKVAVPVSPSKPPPQMVARCFKDEDATPPVACPEKPLSPSDNPEPSKAVRSKLTASPKQSSPSASPPKLTSATKPEPQSNVKTEPQPPQTPPPLPTQRSSSLLIPTKASPPVTYPCPYCPRQLRHSKLLAAHVSNYHKDVRSSAKSRAATRNRNRTSLHSLSSRSSEITDQPHSATMKTNSKSADQSRISATPEPPKFTRLLACHRCDTRSYVTDSEKGLIQCQCCLCWVHQKCYNLKGPKAVELLCDGCLLSDRTARGSRLHESHTSWMRTGQFPWDRVPPSASSVTESRNDTLRHLIAETSTILNWTHHLRPLLRSGWSILDRTKLSVSSPPPPTVIATPSLVRSPSQLLEKSTLDRNTKPAMSDLHSVSGGGPLLGNDASKTMCTKLSDISGHDLPVGSEDQVNRLYLELRGLAFDPTDTTTVDALHSRPLSSNPNVVEDTTFSPPESVCAPACWPLINEDITYSADTSNADPNEVTSSQVLTGFLQDLGPNVMPELTDLGADSIGPETADVDDFFKPHMIDRRSDGDDRHTPLNSSMDTPTKGLGALLSSPSGVATVLQATLGHSDLSMSNGCGPIGTETPLKTRVHTSNASFRKKHNSTSALDDPTTCFGRSLNLASAPSLVTDFLSAPLIDELPAAHLFPTTTTLTASPGKLTMEQDATTLSTSTTDPHSLKTDVVASTPVLPPVDMEWISVSAATTNDLLPSAHTIPYMSNPALSRSDSSSKEPLATVTSSAIYDDLVPTSSFIPLYSNLADNVLTDDTIDRVNTASRQLDELDERILTPLELTLSVMESRLEALNAELSLLEQQQTELVRGRFQHISNDNEDIEDGVVAYQQVDSNTTSPFCSSSSSTFSLSPSRPMLDEMPASDSPGDPSRVNTQYTLMAGDSMQFDPRKAARKLYRFTMSQRAARLRQPDPLTNSAGPVVNPRSKAAATHLFPARNMSSRV